MADKLNQMIWSEKYRPSTIKDCVLPTQTKAMFLKFVESGSIPNLILSGSAGTGKTTAAYALTNELGYEALVINGSNEGRLLDTLRNIIVPFCSGISFDGKRKVVIFDEFDFCPQETVQPALRNFMDSFSNCSFIFTCNFPNKIIEPLKSRCSFVDFVIPPDDKKQMMTDVAIRTFSILKEQGIEFDKAATVGLVKQYFPDFRKLLNEIQAASASGVLDDVTVGISKGADYEQLFSILRSSKWLDMRQWVGSQSNLDIVRIGRALDAEGDKLFKKESLPQFILTTAEYQYKNDFMVDKEVNIAAYLTSIMTQCEFN